MAKKGFEDELERLESLVEELDRGELGLDDAIERYEQAVRAYRRCKRYLAQARKKIEILLKESEGNLRVVPFEKSAEESPGDTARGGAGEQ